MTVKETDVELFLKEMRDKINIFDVAFRPREKNMDSLATLDILPIDRIVYLKKLTADNYHSGPKPDNENPSSPHYYEFGVMIKGFEVYIKLSLGRPDKRVDCMSFHIAERKITYPLQ